jgi:bifunctional DNA-binding transcriptional regulator/antitoxin component of YhaV-PrlF toxin-antitoxin module
MKIYKILGKRGRITLPQEIRQEMGFKFNDVVSFERRGDVVTVRREKVCDHCKAVPAPERNPSAAALTDLLNDLTAEELRTALIHLSVRWAEMQRGGESDA